MFRKSFSFAVINCAFGQNVLCEMRWWCFVYSGSSDNLKIVSSLFSGKHSLRFYRKKLSK